MRWDFFHKTESKNPKVQVYILDLDTTDVVEALRMAYESKKLPRGSYRCGCFEIQSDVGIWQHAEEKRIDFSLPCRAAKVNFISWE